MKLACMLRAAMVSALVMAAQSAFAGTNATSAEAPDAAGPRRPMAAGTHPQARAVGKAQNDQGLSQHDKEQSAQANAHRVRALLKRPAPRSGVSTVAAARRRAAGAATTPGAAAARARFGESRAAIADSSQRREALLGRKVPPGRAQQSAGAAAALPARAAPNPAVSSPQNFAAKARTLGRTAGPAYVRLGGPVSTKAGATGALDGAQLRRRKY
jgi:hypothetical protein